VGQIVTPEPQGARMRGEWRAQSAIWRIVEKGNVTRIASKNNSKNKNSNRRNNTRKSNSKNTTRACLLFGIRVIIVLFIVLFTP
jgi:hypothetical protein